MEISSIIRVFFILCLCICLSLEQIIHTREKKVKKNKDRKKLRCSRCFRKITGDINRMIDDKLSEFKAAYIESAPVQKEKRHTDNLRMQENLLRLSADMSETKNALRILTNDLQTVMGELTKTKKNYDKLSRRINHMGGALGNLTKYVDSMEERLAYRAGPFMGTEMAQREQSSQDPKKMPTQCQDVFEQGGMRFSGDYYIMIKPAGVTHAFKALCQMVNNSGWTVIQRRQDGSVDFFREWEDYRLGFGSLEGEFWLGNDNIHYLTSQEPTMLRIEMEDWNGNYHFAVYDYFKVDGLKDKYRLHIRGYHGNAGDSLTSLYENHDGMPFSTVDNDNDERYYDSCAKIYKGGWWFNNCFEAHLNGIYYHKGFHKNFFQRDGITWNTIHMYSSLKFAQMMIKPANYVHHAKDSKESAVDNTSSTTTVMSNEVKTPV